MKTDFCIVGFPKCGTSALARFLERSQHINLMKMNGKYEAPLFINKAPSIDAHYQEGLLNGHKYTAYAYSLQAMQSILENSPQALIIFCVRDIETALYSWHNMHRRIAIKGDPQTHFVNQDEETQRFYRECSVEDYYWKFARDRLTYAAHINRILEKWADVKFALVSQLRLAQDAKTVVSRLHELMGKSADPEYLDKLPQQHESFGDTARSKTKLPEEISAELKANNAALLELIDSLPERSNLTSRQRVI